MKLSGKTILITGASRGIGAETAKEAAKRGCKKIILVARSEPELKEVGEEVKKLGAEPFIYTADLMDSAAIEDLGEKVRKEHGIPDVLVNNAGAGRWIYCEETSAEELDLMISLPYLAAFNVTRQFLKGMMDRKSGQIVNVNSPASVMAWPGSTGYIASRFALRGFTEALQMDLKGTGVIATNFTPGKVSSTYFRDNPGSEDRIPGIAKMIPTLTPEETARRLMNCVARGKKRMITPFMLALFYFFQQITPGIVRWIVYSTGWKREV